MRAWLGTVLGIMLLGGSAEAQEPDTPQPEVEAGPDAVQVPEPGTEEEAAQPVEDPGADTGEEAAQPTEEGPAVDVPEAGTEERAAEPEIVPGPPDEGTIWQETCECPCPLEEGGQEGEGEMCECPCPLEGGAAVP